MRSAREKDGKGKGKGGGGKAYGYGPAYMNSGYGMPGGKGYQGKGIQESEQTKGKGKRNATGSMLALWQSGASNECGSIARQSAILFPWELLDAWRT